MLLALAIACLGAQARRSTDDVAAQLMQQYEQTPDVAISAVTRDRVDTRAVVLALRKNTSAPARLRAIFALELAFSAMRDDMVPTPLRNPLADLATGADPSRNRPKPAVFADVFNAASELATSVKNDPAFAKAWNEAALAMLEAGSEVLPATMSRPGTSAHLLEAFLDRNTDAFEKGRWHLARASVHERLIAEIIDYDWPTYKGFHQPSGNTVGAQAEGNLTRAQAAGLAELQKARQHEAYLAQADVHIAEMLLERNKKDDLSEALVYVGEALGRSLDKPTLYLVHLVRGRIEVALGNRREATAEFFASSQAIPDADAATFNLASQLFLGGDLEQANALVRHALAAKDVVDPWAFFLMPEYQDWELRLQALRGQRR
ncbi:MAG TPA: hypothetical protein VJN96_27345 [Vicinamibacterales bacterium]|nr:hypothetical protein [Vicinamibacterales bacterium]